jgi:hypothetical protein
MTDFGQECMISFVTFADDKFAMEATRLTKQLSRSPIRSRLFIWTPEDLIKSTPAVLLKEDIKKRGVGFWKWKPFIILQTMRLIPEDEILIYLDAGCSINPRQIQSLAKYVEFIKINHILCFESGKSAVGSIGLGQVPTWTQGEWTKKNVVEYFSLDTKKLQFPQRVATVIGFKKCEKALSLLEDWSNICGSEELINDEIGNNERQEFIEHRHDQSIFSILTYKNDLKSLSNREIELPGQSSIAWKLRLRKQFIIASRRRGLTYMQRLKKYLFR